MSGQIERRGDVSTLLLHQCGLVGCRGGEASNPGPVFPSGREVTSSDEEPVLALVLQSTQPVSGTLPTWVDSDRPQVDGPGRNVRQRWRVRSVSPTILVALEEDLEANVVSTVPGSSQAVRRRDDEEAALTSIDDLGHNEEVGATEVDRESSIFDMTVADSADEVDVPQDVSRRRRRARRRVQDSDGATNEEGSASSRAVRRLVLVQS